MNPQEQDRLIRRPEVRQITGLSDSALDRAMRAGHFPRPIPLLPTPDCRSVAWPASVCYRWVAERIAQAAAA